MKIPAICFAPEYLAEELLRLEGFSEVAYGTLDQHTSPDLLMTNHADISIQVNGQWFCPTIARRASWAACARLAPVMSTEKHGYEGA